jgi:hypothetical protein
VKLILSKLFKQMWIISISWKSLVCVYVCVFILTHLHHMNLVQHNIQDHAEYMVTTGWEARAKTINKYAPRKQLQMPGRLRWWCCTLNIYCCRVDLMQSSRITDSQQINWIHYWKLLSPGLLSYLYCYIQWEIH